MQPRCIAYIALAGDDRIASLALDGDTGGLEPLADLKIGGGPGPLALSPQGSRMYVALRDSREMASLVVDRSTGALQHLETIGLHSDPCQISTDRTGGFLLSAYYTAGGVAVHAIDERGAVVELPLVWRKTMPKAHCAMTDPSNRFVFLPHVGESNTILILSQKVCAGRIRTNVPTPEYNIQPLFRILPQHTVALRCAKTLELPQNGFLRGNQSCGSCSTKTPAV